MAPRALTEFRTQWTILAYVEKFAKYFETLSHNKTGTSKVGAISKAQKAQFSKYAQDVFMKSFENTFETPKVCLSCSI